MTLAVPDAAGVADADAQKVLKAFVAMLYGAAAEALEPPLTLALVHTAHYYGTEAIAAAAADALAAQLEEARDGDGAEERSLLAVARAVLALPDALLQLSQGQGLVAAAAAICADHLPQDLMAAWQPGTGAGDKAKILKEPAAAVVAALLTRCLESGRLCPDSAFAIAAGWADAQRGGGSAHQRRALLEALPLRALSDDYFTTAALGSALATALAPDELHMLWLLRWADAGRGHGSLHLARAPKIAAALPPAWADERSAFSAPESAGAGVEGEYSAEAIVAAAAGALTAAVMAGTTEQEAWRHCKPASQKRCFVAGYDFKVALVADARERGGKVRLVPTILLSLPFKGAAMTAAEVVRPCSWVSAVLGCVAGGECVALGSTRRSMQHCAWADDWVSGSHALLESYGSAAALAQAVAGRTIQLRALLTV